MIRRVHVCVRAGSALQLTHAATIADSPINVVLETPLIKGKSFGLPQLNSMRKAVAAEANARLLRDVTPHALVALVTATCGYSLDNAHRLVHTLDTYGCLDGLRVALLHVTLGESAWDLLCLVLPGDSPCGVLKRLHSCGHIYLYLPSATSKAGSLYDAAGGKEGYDNPSFMGLLGQTQHADTTEKRVIMASGKAMRASASPGGKRPRESEDMARSAPCTTVESSFVFTAVLPALAKKYVTLARCAVPAKLAGSSSIHAALFG